MRIKLVYPILKSNAKKNVFFHLNELDLSSKTFCGNLSFEEKQTFIQLLPAIGQHQNCFF